MKYTPITQKSDTIGQYPIHIHGVRISVQIYLDYDGENWIGIESLIQDEAERNIENMVYLNTPSLLGLHKPQFTLFL